MEGTTKNTNSTAKTTDTKIALGLLQQNQTFKAIYSKASPRGKRTKIWVHLITYMP